MFKKEKIEIAIKLTNISKIIVCGGVASNLYIRKILSDFDINFPLVKFCTDNGIMISKCAYNHYIHNTKFVNNFSLEVFARKSLIEFYNLI